LPVPEVLFKQIFAWGGVTAGAAMVTNLTAAVAGF
jgi:hypothetical protein